MDASGLRFFYRISVFLFIGLSVTLGGSILAFSQKLRSAVSGSPTLLGFLCRRSLWRHLSGQVDKEPWLVETSLEALSWTRQVWQPCLGQTRVRQTWARQTGVRQRALTGFAGISGLDAIPAAKNSRC